MEKIEIKRALISVYDKSGVLDLAQFLINRGVEILSSGGTAAFFQENNIPVTEISTVTGFPEILEGRVKTLHPLIHGGILAKRNQKHLKQLKEHQINPIDLVVVNLYPFELIFNFTRDMDTLIENIDIGGPTLIRAAAKNHPFVTVLTSPEDYGIFIEEYDRENAVSSEFRKKMAVKAFAYTSYYDSIICRTFEKAYHLDEEYRKKTFPLRLQKKLRYGENPHQRAWLYEDPFNSSNHASIINAKQLWGKELSYNNYIDLDSAFRMSLEFSEPFACILKHTNPCGAAIADSIEEAFRKALSGDPKSAFGGIIGVNQSVSRGLAEQITSSFFECVIAPSYEQEALDILKKKKNLRILDWSGLKPDVIRELEIKRISGGFLLQENDSKFEPVSSWELKAGERYGDEKELEFAWKMVKYVKSNAIILVKNSQLIGVGAGQMSRVDAVFMAIQKAKEQGFDLDKAILASDAFFPFPDSIELAFKEGIKIFIEPGGSIRDKDVIEKAKELGVTLYFTHTRHFKH